MLISYAHGDLDEDKQVEAFWRLLRREGIDARIDLMAAAKRQFWPEWMTEQIELADYVLVVVSRYQVLAEAGPRRCSVLVRGVRFGVSAS